MIKVSSIRELVVMGFEEEVNSMVHYQERMELFQEMYEEYHVISGMEFSNTTIIGKGDVER